MSALSLIPVSLLESYGLGLVQQAADQAFGAGVLKLEDDSNGISMGLTLSGGQSIDIDDLSIGAEGLSGRFHIEGLDANPLSATLLDGFTIALTAFDLTLTHAGLGASHVAGHFTIPFFTDKHGNPETVDVELSFKSDGSFTISLAAVESVQETSPDGLVELQYTISDVATVELDVASLEIDKSPDGTWKIVISGRLDITTADLQWPTFELTGLGIDSKGHISLAGGWIDLPSQTALDFYGFHVALQKLGFGSDPTGRWVGFNGDIHLVEGISLGGSVQGLRINLDTGAVSLAGVDIAFEIPDVLSFEGEIDHVHVTATKPDDLAAAGLNPTIFNYIDPQTTGNSYPPGKEVNVFFGAVKVNIIAIELEVDAKFIVGTFGGNSVFFLDIDAELPVGIPIFLDVSLYGLQGLVATGLQPQPEPAHTWWEWYKYPDNGAGPDTSAAPDYSATDASKWLYPKSGAFALGAGVTIGTSVDDGFTASAAVTLILLLPGPVIMLVGKANILQKRMGGASEDANFEAMATYDGTSSTFDMVIEAQYQIPVVLDIEATAELFVGEGSWFFAMGKPPHDKRVKARIFDLFETDAYFVISDSGLMVGTWTGYRASYSFGPLSASIDAYLATQAAVQWSPFQLAGGIELHGDIHLSAFGIGMGLTADALLEGSAPHPFWVHGEVSVELDLPWPLPNVGATISLTWGGDDGSVPPAPLALAHIDAVLSDHSDVNDKASSDHYTLLAHKNGGPRPDLTVQYDDPNTPGILTLTSQVRTAADTPDMTPDNSSLSQLAPVVPQDAHFTLSFAHPVIDLAGFENSTTAAALPGELVTVTTPSIVGPDDMSNINTQAPAVQWEIRHTLLEVAIYQWDAFSAAWDLVCSMPPPATLGDTRMNGVWLSPDKADPRQIQQQLKVFPWRLLPGAEWSAQWTGAAPGQNFGTVFQDQGLIIEGSETNPAVIATVGGNIPTGLQFTAVSGANAPSVTIVFEQPVVVLSIASLTYLVDGEFTFVDAPPWSGDGNPLTPVSSSQDTTTEIWTQVYDSQGAAIRELSVPLNGTLEIYAISYASPPSKMAVLPTAPALYAIKAVTEVQAGRVNNGTPAYQPVQGASPVVEFAYLQTASGPGTAELGPPPPAGPPDPAGPPPFPQLAANCSPVEQPPSAFPLAGALDDLHTYTQWSWPLDGAPAAYWGYDVNVEFVESYVNALYTAFSNGSVSNSLHFRCVDRNHNHTLLQPVAIHVPSIPMQSALVAKNLIVPLPAPLAPPPRPGITGVLGQIAVKDAGTLARAELQPVQPKLVAGLQAQLAARAETLSRSVPADALDGEPVWPTPAIGIKQLLQTTGLGSGKSATLINQLTATELAALMKQLKEAEDAATALRLWFRPLAPSTLYTLDVVAGPFNRYSRDSFTAAGGQGGLLAIFQAQDASGVLAALEAYYAYEDALTTLARVQFTTSRYATFAAQMANAAAQVAGTAGIPPMRRYKTAADVAGWGGNNANIGGFTDAEKTYLLAKIQLIKTVQNFDSLADDLQPGAIPAVAGKAALVFDRQATASAWQAFSQASNACFDTLIALVGRPELASRQKPVAVPDTEISLITDESGFHVVAILLESPEALPWQRTWLWTTLKPASASATDLRGSRVFWNADGTKGLVVPLGSPRGSYDLQMAFQGNVGAELPCITLDGAAVTDTVDLGAIELGPNWIRQFPPLPVDEGPVLRHDG
jgi:hypothetical protein